MIPLDGYAGPWKHWKGIPSKIKRFLYICQTIRTCYYKLNSLGPWEGIPLRYMRGDCRIWCIGSNLKHLWWVGRPWGSLLSSCSMANSVTIIVTGHDYHATALYGHSAGEHVVARFSKFSSWLYIAELLIRFIYDPFSKSFSYRIRLNPFVRDT